MTSIVIPVYVSVEETRLSRAVERAGIVGKHRHDWVFVHGRGISGSSASGNGLGIDHLPDSKLYAQFLEATAKYRGVDEARNWLELMLNPEHSNLLCAGLDSTWDEPGAFANAKKYEELHGQTVRFLRILEPALPLPPGLDDAQGSGGEGR